MRNRDVIPPITDLPQGTSYENGYYITRDMSGNLKHIISDEYLQDQAEALVKEDEESAMPSIVESKGGLFGRLFG
jgi:hypothetical protein